MKKQFKKFLLICSLLPFLTACSQNNEASTSNDFWGQYFISPLSEFILWLSGLFGNNYAFAIIFFTILIRVLLLPLNRFQMKSQRQMQEIQPELDAIKDKYPNKDRDSLEKMREEQSALMEKRGVNQFAGCLPLLIQFPVMIALYNTILRTEELRQGHFLWMNLGQPDPYFILPFLAAGFAFYSSYLTMKSSLNQNGAMKGMMYVMPFMILLITIGLPSAIGIYFVTSNAFTVFQTLLFNNPYKIIAEREKKRELEKEKQRSLQRQLRRATGKSKRK